EVLHTENGGHSWQHIQVGNAAGVRFNAGALAANGTDGIIAATLFSTFSTTDAGATWTAFPVPFPSFAATWYGAAFVPNSSRQILAGIQINPLVSIATTDLGTSFTGVAATNGSLRFGPLRCVASAVVGSHTNIIAGGILGYVLSTNGGTSWA